MDQIIKRSDVHKKYGIPDAVLDRICHMQDSPAFKFKASGHWYFKTKALDEVLAKLEGRATT